MKRLLHHKQIWLFLLIPFSFLLSFIASKNPQLAEGYAVTVYPVLSKGINAVSSLFPFSLVEVIVVAGILFLLFLGIRLVLRLIRRQAERKILITRAVCALLAAASVISFVFTLTCGINYSRIPFSQVSGLTLESSSVQQLKELCADLALQANRLRGELPTDSNGVTTISDWNQTAKKAQAAMNSMEKSYPTLKSGYGGPKAVFFSRFMSYCDITGIFIPFTIEANVNADVPDYSIPATMLHELSHMRGYMREDEANFIAYLACKNSNDPLFEYSGIALAFLHANNALFAADQQAGRETYALLNEEVKRDFSASSAYWKQFEGPIADTAQKVNDSYLKSNGQTDGVQSYGRMVDLLLAEHRQNQKEK